MTLIGHVDGFFGSVKIVVDGQNGQQDQKTDQKQDDGMSHFGTPFVDGFSVLIIQQEKIGSNDSPKSQFQVIQVI
ncbi:hypothetical protein SDC9_164774 [bioreactor metagenome]|uniref:Uncharacterized protein n=1 Tax=bioreactor metagenome TaxID=1076179 RepID=A0A645FSK2_9ZZZZ